MDNPENKEEETKKEEVKKGNKPNHTKIIVAVAVISFVISSFFGAAFGFMAARIGQGKFSLHLPKFLKQSQNQGLFSNSNSGSAQTISVTDEESAVIEAVKKGSPAVVSIIISKQVPQTPDFFSDPF
ncbi:MAG TPA: hypothetical protein VK254_04220, partial [Candidatus Bathyarchaeia archaeon]|nr:hypothetical protein [Candidatus Bathyarchaeia archaeon]